jgi:hypothetical protein
MAPRVERGPEAPACERSRSRVRLARSNAAGTHKLYDTGNVPPPPVLSNVSFSDGSGRAYAPGETVSLRVGDQVGLFVRGQLSNGEEAGLRGATVALETSKPAVASIDSSGTIALSAGVTRITASVTPRRRHEGYPPVDRCLRFEHIDCRSSPHASHDGSRDRPAGRDASG